MIVSRTTMRCRSRSNFLAAAIATAGLLARCHRPEPARTSPETLSGPTCVVTIRVSPPEAAARAHIMVAGRLLGPGDIGDGSTTPAAPSTRIPQGRLVEMGVTADGYLPFNDRVRGDHGDFEMPVTLRRAP